MEIVFRINKAILCVKDVKVARGVCLTKKKNEMKEVFSAIHNSAVTAK